MKTIDKTPYWNRLVDYYYDNIYWQEDTPPSINDWLYREYNCESSYYQNTLAFKNPRDYTLFALRFSQ